MKKIMVLWLAVLLGTAGLTGCLETQTTVPETEEQIIDIETAETESDTAEETPVPETESVPEPEEIPERHMLTAQYVQQGENAMYVTCGDTFVLLRFDPETLLYYPYDNRDFPITEKGWAMISPTSDGRILLWDAAEPARYTVWSEGELYQSGEYDQVLWFCGDWVLAAHDGLLGIYNADGDLMKTLCHWNGGMSFREGLSGWYEEDPTGGAAAAGMYVFLTGAENEYYVIEDTGIPERENAVPGMEPLPMMPMETTWYLYAYRSGYITAQEKEEALPEDSYKTYLGTLVTHTAEPQFDSVGGKLVIGELGQWTLYDPYTGISESVPVPEGATQVYIRLHPETDALLGSIVCRADELFAWCSPEGVPLTEYKFRSIGQVGGSKYLIGSEDRPETEDEYDSRNWVIDASTGECREIGWEGVEVLEAGDVIFFKCNDWYDTSNNIMILREDLTPIREERFFEADILPDGRLLGIPMSDGENRVRADHFEIYDRDGNLTFTSRAYDEVICLAGEYIAVNNGGRLCLTDAEDNLLVDFDPWTEDMFMHFMLSGYVADGKDLQNPENTPETFRYHYRERNDDGVYVDAETDRYPAGVYLLTEDESVEYGVTGRAREYFWCPDTGLVGMLAFGEVGGYAKPVLYLYPEEETDVTVTFSRPELLTTVYPAYNDGWQVTVSPDGTMTDKRGREYYALYWEESGYVPVDFSTGFCVAGEDAAAFLEEKLDVLGLTNREANEMIMYWLPILEKNAYSLVYFELTQSREAYNRLQISPMPDSLLRIALHIKAADGPAAIREQRLFGWEREGFAAVEWGGVIHE